MASSIIFTAWAVAGLASCSTVLERVAILPEGWSEVDARPEPSQAIRLSIALRQPDLAELSPSVVSSDESPVLSREQTNALQRPDQGDAQDVLRWLSEQGIEGTTKAENSWIHVQTSVDMAEPLLNMTLGQYAFENNDPVLRTKEYSVPDSLVDAIAFVHPISNFMAPKKEFTDQAPQVSARTPGRRDFPCADRTTPQCIRELYNMTYDAPTNDSSVRFGVTGFLEQFANHDDVHTFLQLMAPDIASTGYDFNVELIHGGENPQEPSKSGDEANLDMDYAMALGYPTNVIFYSTGGRGPQLGDDGNPLPSLFVDNEPYLELLEYLLDLPDSEVPHVLSISYADNEVSVPQPYAERVCHMFGLLTARGTSILSGSGDGGARGGFDSNCRTNDGSNREITMATFPASCPWVTSVGGTTNAAPSPFEGAYFSTGGFSQYFPRPEWQDEAVEGYVDALNGHLEPYYNASMRAMPDISAIASSFQVIFGSRRHSLQGTSASTPVIAAMIALIDDARARQGKGPLGWLNKKLYSKEVREVLTDVVDGVSKSCIFEGGKEPGGWPAAKGYDAITGLGVPGDFQAFLKVLVDA